MAGQKILTALNKKLRRPGTLTLRIALLGASGSYYALVVVVDASSYYALLVVVVDASLVKRFSSGPAEIDKTRMQ